MKPNCRILSSQFTSLSVITGLHHFSIIPPIPMKKLSLLFLSILVCVAGFSHSGKAKYHVILDTDGTPDDFRTLAVLLSSPVFETIAVTCKDDSPQGVLKKDLQAFLAYFHHEGIPVYAYNSSNASEAFTDFISKEMAHEQGIIDIFSCGNTIIPTALPASEKIRITIFNNSSESVTPGYDGFAHKYIVLTNSIVFQPELDKGMYSNYDTHYLKYTVESLQNENAALQSETIPLYWMNPSLFIKKDNIFFPDDTKKDSLSVLLQNALITDISSESRVFYGFPSSTNLYSDDVAAIMNAAIEKHGVKEFRLGVLTNELHGHLGIYAMVGAKMGLRVRELYDIGVDDIFIHSYAGDKPPLSCMNDGLQVSTGATVGHGLFALAEDSLLFPAATFTFKNRKVTCTLKPEIANQIKQDIGNIISEKGLLTPEYWSALRELALIYWRDWDRHEMFLLEFS